MTNVEINSLLLNRFGDKLSVDVENIPAREPRKYMKNKVRVYFPSNVRLDFFHSSENDFVKVVCLFMNGIPEIASNVDVFDDYSTSFDRTEKGKPFDEFGFDCNFDNVGYKFGICLVSEVKKEDFTLEKVNEFARYVTQPTPFMKYLIKLACARPIKRKGDKHGKTRRRY